MANASGQPHRMTEAEIVSNQIHRTLKSQGILRDMVRDAEAVGANLVVTWSRSIRKDQTVPTSELTICFRSAAVAGLAETMLKRRMPDVVSDDAAPRGAATAHGRNFIAC